MTYIRVLHGILVEVLHRELLIPGNVYLVQLRGLEEPLLVLENSSYKCKLSSFVRWKIAAHYKIELMVEPELTLNGEVLVEVYLAPKPREQFLTLDILDSLNQYRVNIWSEFHL